MDLKESIALFKASMRNRLFALGAIFLMPIWLLGCGPTLQETFQKTALEGMKRASDSASKWREDFLNCTRDYAVRNARSLASAPEIADGAVSQCQFYLSAYKMNEDSYHKNAILVSNPSMSIERARVIGEERSRLDAQELMEQGRRLVINNLVQIRQ